MVRKSLTPLARTSDHYQLDLECAQSEAQFLSAASSGSAYMVDPVGYGRIALEELVAAAALAGWWCSVGYHR